MGKYDDRKWMIESYKSNECTVCDRKKQPKFFFCRRCWARLQTSTQSHLILVYKEYGLASDQMLQAFDMAVEELKE